MTATMEMNNRVLVLNKNWAPVNVMSVMDAIGKVWAERAKIVDPETYQMFAFEEWVTNWEDAIRDSRVAADQVLPGAGFKLVLPSVIVCTEYAGFQSKGNKNRPKFSRTNIYRRDKNRCQFCGAKHKMSEMTLDHVIPKSQGGEMNWRNIVLACFECNQHKRDRTPQQAHMRLIREPFVPTAADVSITPMERLNRKIGENAPKTWEQFLGKMYMNVELKN
jgi:hypothetical protein